MFRRLAGFARAAEFRVTVAPTSGVPDGKVETEIRTEEETDFATSAPKPASLSSLLPRMKRVRMRGSGRQRPSVASSVGTEESSGTPAADASVGLAPAELEALLTFACVELPRLRAPLGEREAELVRQLYLLVDALGDAPRKRDPLTDGVPDADTVQSMLRAAQALASASVQGAVVPQAAAHATGADSAAAGARHGVPRGPFAALGQTSPIAAAERLEAERLELRRQLGKPLPHRVEPFDVVYSGLQHSRERIEREGSPTSRAQLAAQRERARRRPSSASRAHEARGARAGRAQPWHSRTGAAPNEPGGPTLFESYETYLAVLRAEQMRLKDERRHLESASRPPEPGWWSLRDPRFTVELQHARRYEEPTPFDWWREPAEPAVYGGGTGMHLVPAVAFHPAARGSAPSVLRNLERRQPHLLASDSDEHSQRSRREGLFRAALGGSGGGGDAEFYSELDDGEAFDALTLTAASPAWTPMQPPRMTTTMKQGRS